MQKHSVGSIHASGTYIKLYSSVDFSTQAHFALVDDGEILEDPWWSEG